MCKFIGISNERILCKLSKSDILRLYSIVYVAMETTKTSHFTCQSKSFISIFFTCQVSACEQQPFSCHDLANGIHTETDKTVFGHLKSFLIGFVNSSKPTGTYHIWKMRGIYHRFDGICDWKQDGLGYIPRQKS